MIKIIEYFYFIIYNIEMWLLNKINAKHHFDNELLWIIDEVISLYKQKK